MRVTRQSAFLISEELYLKVKKKAQENETNVSQIIRDLLVLWVQGKIDNKP